MKEGCLFVVFVSMRSTRNQDASDCVLGLFGKLSRTRGSSAWFHCNPKLGYINLWMSLIREIRLFVN